MNSSNSILAVYKNHIQYYPTNYSLNYSWSLGSLSGIFLSLQLVTGFMMASHYLPYEYIVFENLEHIVRDVDFGWLFRYMHSNGASFFFIVLYLHIFRGLYYKSYIRPRHFTWVVGVVILLISILTAFIGYVLPWGQMSFWGATVITNSVTAIPVIGDRIVLWIWGGFTVSSPTIVRFFNFHYFMAIVLSIIAILHLIFLHQPGSSGPLVYSSEKIKFFSYFYLKDVFVLILVVLAYFVITVYFPNLLGHHYNYIRANPLVTPTHIVPEWYFLPFYTILRSFDNKLVGVIAMILSILLLLTLPYVESGLLSKSYLPAILDKFTFYFLMFSVFGLWWIGSLPAIDPYVMFGRLFTAFYFSYYVMLYVCLKLSLIFGEQRSITW